jgi:hypothetical protein
MNDVAAIAKGLTKAQQRWLIDAYYGSHGWQICGYRPKACELGLCLPRSSRLTPLGLAVRAIIEKEQNDADAG